MNIKCRCKCRQHFNKTKCLSTSKRPTCCISAQPRTNAQSKEKTLAPWFFFVPNIANGQTFL